MRKAVTGALSEPEFAALVDTCAAAPDGREQLTDLLREDHPCYDQRGTATTVRMRGWVLLALARAGVPDTALPFVLEELESGADAYLVAAAARALRSYAAPAEAWAPILMGAIRNIRYRDDLVSFDGYGEYAVSSAGTSPLRELLAALEWLGPRAQKILGELESLAKPPAALPNKLLIHVERAVAAIRGPSAVEGACDGSETCCALPVGLRSALLWAPASRRRAEPAGGSIAFEDHDGAQTNFKDFFSGHPSIVVFFYTRCDNPMKCSLTVTKLGRIQKLLEERGLAGKVYTAAITYDPAFDHAERLRRYGLERGVRLNASQRMLRATAGIDALRSHFQLGVNFIESLVNRHRIELFILDADARIAASFHRLQWDEVQVVDRTIKVLEESALKASEMRLGSTLPGNLAAIALAIFPKCPVCWAAYLSVAGIAGAQRIPYPALLQPVLMALMFINIASVWFRGRSNGRLGGAYLVTAGALAIAASRIGEGWELAATSGVALTIAGSIWSVVDRSRNGRGLSMAARLHPE